MRPGTRQMKTKAMNQQLFGQVEQREGPITERETTFDFLARGGRPEAVQIRSWMEKWYQKFPADHRHELKRRLQSKNFSEFMSAYFELQVFAILCRRNCRIDIHPSFAGSEGTVDFHVANDKEEFYVEATVCGIGQGILHSNANEEDAVRKIKASLANPHSDLWLSAEGELNQTLSKQRVLEPFQGLLNRYTAGEVRRLCPGPGWAHEQRQLSVSIVEGNWRLEGYLAPPIASDGRGQIHGPIKGGLAEGAGPLKSAIEKKVDDWKGKELSKEMFVIAVNACHSEFSWGDESDAIFGNQELVSDCSVFADKMAELNGVIVFDNAVLGAERSARVKLYRNGNMSIPECLQCLVSERALGGLLGFE